MRYINGKMSHSEDNGAYWANYSAWYEHLYHNMSDDVRKKCLFDGDVIDTLTSLKYPTNKYLSAENKGKQKLVVMIGLPSSGKSTITSDIIDRHRSILDDPYIAISSDDITKELYQDDTPYHKINHSELFDTLNEKTITLLKKGYNVVYDSNNLKRKHRLRLLEKISEMDVIKVAILLAPTEAECIRRNSIKKSPTPNLLINKDVRDFQPPFFNEGWDYIIPSYMLELDTGELSDVDRGEIFEYENLEWDNIMKYNQNEDVHKYTLGGHIETVEYYIEENHPHAIWLLDTALYHDIGKLFTRVDIYNKREGRYISNYHNHSNYSAYFLLTRNRYAGINKIKTGMENQLVHIKEHVRGSDVEIMTYIYNRFVYDLYVANLCCWHMCFFHDWKHDITKMKEDRNFMGIGMWDDLNIFRIADEAARN